MKLFIGNLPYDIDNNGLGAIFQKFGNVISAVVVMDRNTNRSKGFGFVELESGGEQAIKETNETQVAGRKIYVSEARPKNDRT